MSQHAHELSEKEMFGCLTRTDSCDESDSPCEPFCAPKPLDFDCVPMVHRNVLTMDGARHTTRHQHQQVYHSRRRLKIRRRRLGFSVGISSKNQTSQQ